MTNTPDDKDGLVDRIAKLEAKVAEMGRKTFNNLTVTDAGTTNAVLQIDKDAANANRARLRIRDSAGDVIMANDTTSGWGYAVPNVVYPMYPNNSSPATQITTAGFQTTYIGAIVVNCPRLNIGMLVESSGGAGGATCQAYPAWGLSPLVGGTWNQVGPTQSVSGTGYQFTRVGTTLLWPSNMFGQTVWLRMYANLSAGAGGGNWVSCTPTYLYGAGV